MNPETPTQSCSRTGTAPSRQTNRREERIPGQQIMWRGVINRNLTCLENTSYKNYEKQAVIKNHIKASIKSD